MPDEVQEQLRQPDVDQPESQANPALEEAARDAYSRETQTGTNTSSTTNDSQNQTGRENGSQSEINFTNLFRTATDAVSRAVDNFTDRLEADGFGLPQVGNVHMNPDRAKPAQAQKDQQGIEPGAFSDIRPDARNATSTLVRRPDGLLERTVVSRNNDGSTTTVKTEEEYVRNGNEIVKNPDGSFQTRVLREQREARDQKNNLTFKAETKNEWGPHGLNSSRTDVFRGGQDSDGKPTVNKYNSFTTNNTYDADGNLTRNESRVLDVNEKSVQSTVAEYGYRDGNRVSENITRTTGNNQTSYEQREHEYERFGDSWQRVATTSTLRGLDGEYTGRLETRYERNADGKLAGESTVQYDELEREAHRFEARYGADGSRTTSTDTHTTWHDNGQEKTRTVSTFNADSDSTSVRTEYDQDGHVVREDGFIQRMDGSIVAHKPGPNGEHKTLLSADAGAELGGFWWGGDRETAWQQLERLSGDAANRDVFQGFRQLGSFAGGDGKQEDAVWKLSKWGQGDATRGVDILEQRWGNGSGRAAQGMDTYLSMGAGAAMQQARERGGEGFNRFCAAVGTLISGGGAGNAAAEAEQGLEGFLQAVEALGSAHQHAERIREKIDKDPAKAGQHVTDRGNGSCEHGVCEFKKDGDDHRETEHGEPCAMERGVDARLRWSSNGDMGEAMRASLELTGGDMRKLGKITGTMGATENIGPDGQIVLTESRLEGNDNMLRFGLQPDGSTNPNQAVEQFKRAGTVTIGDTVTYDAILAANNIFNAGIATEMVDGKPVINPETGEPYVLRSSQRTVDAILAVGGNNPVYGMDAVTALSTKRDADGNVESIDPTVGFQNLAHVGDRQQIVDGTPVTLSNVMVSAEAIRAAGAPPTDLNGQPVQQFDAQGNPVPPGFVLNSQNQVVPQGVAGADALARVTTTEAGVNPERLIPTLQEMTTNNRINFERAAVEGATFSAVGTVTSTLQEVGREAGQKTGSMDAGIQYLVGTHQAADGRSFQISTSVAGGYEQLSRADNPPAGQLPTADRGVAVMASTLSDNGTFRQAAENTAALANTTDASGNPTRSTEMFSQGITNVQAYGNGDYARGAEVITHIGGGANNPEAARTGVTEVRAAADSTTGGNVYQMAAVTTAAGNGNTRDGADALMSYKGREGESTGSYSRGATALYQDMYGPNASPATGTTLQAGDVRAAVSLAAPNTAPTEMLQSGMSKVNAIVDASPNREVTGAQVLTNLTNPANAPAFTQVQRASDAGTAVQALREQGTLAAVTAPVATTQTVAVAAASSAREAAVAAESAVKQPATVAREVAVQSETAVSNQQTVAASAAVQPEAQRAESTVMSTATSSDARTVAAAETQTKTAAGDNTEATVARAAAADVASGTESSRSAQEKLAAAAVEANNAAAQVQREVKQSNDEQQQRLVAAANSQQTAKQPDVALQQILRSIGSDNATFSKSIEKIATAQSFSTQVTGEKAAANAAQPVQPSVKLQQQQQIDANRTFGNAIVAATTHSQQRGQAGITDGGNGRQTFNLSVSQNSYLKQAVYSSDVARAVRQSEASTAKAAGAAISSIKSGGADAGSARPAVVRPVGQSSTNSTNSTSNRVMDAMIMRSLKGGTTISETTKDFTVRGKMRKLGKGQRELLGAEIALAALLVSASISKERAEQKKVELRRKAGIQAELSKMSDRLEAVAELSQDDDATKAATYQNLVRPTWLVRPNEDLVKLAEHLFHEAELGWLIADLNAGQIKESYLDGKRIVELRTRQKIDLPVWQDIVEFHKRRNPQARPENLVTIVTETSVDKELMQSTLALAMGATVAPAPAGARPVVAPVALAVAGTPTEAKDRPAAAVAVKVPNLVNSAKHAALAVRKATSAVVAATNDQDQGPTAGAAVTEEQLQPRYV